MKGFDLRRSWFPIALATLAGAFLFVGGMLLEGWAMHVKAQGLASRQAIIAALASRMDAAVVLVSVCGRATGVLFIKHSGDYEIVPVPDQSHAAGLIRRIQQVPLTHSITITLNKGC